jgi:hypothetical protein
MKRAVRHAGARVQVVERRQLRYGRELAERVGTGWVRSGSALVRFGSRLLMVQDDALWLAWLDEAGRLEVEPLGSSAERLFSDKRKKPDFEAAAVIPGAPERALIFGSGSLASRERVVLLGGDREPRLIHTPALYAALRGDARFCPEQLNIEGAFVDGAALVLCSRGNGGATFDTTVSLPLGELLAYLDAPELGRVPRLGEVEQYELGSVEGVRLTLTDATLHAGVRYYLAAAEASPDAIADGPVLAAALGVLSDEPRYALIEDERGAPLRDKVEGLCVAQNAGDWLAIVDADDASRPAELLLLRCRGLS